MRRNNWSGSSPPRRGRHKHTARIKNQKSKIKNPQRVKPNFYPVILAGGRGTRFWPLSRKKRAKQMLALNSERSMIQETVERLAAVAPEKRFWIITNVDLRDGIRKQLPKLPKAQVVAEPAGRNTAPAIGLAAFLIAREDPRAIHGLFPSGHVIENEKRFTARPIAGAVFR